jgi:hypothetical protein
MALPKLNDVPKYELVVPSTGKTVSFRPFLVKEQKVLLMAMEAQNSRQILQAVSDTIASCVYDDIKVNSLATYDIEYIFTQIRAKSVGENVKLNMICKSCENTTEVGINLEDIKVNTQEVEDNVVKLNDTYSLQLKPPSYRSVLESNLPEAESLTDNLYNTIILSLDCLLTEEDKIEFANESIEEIESFINSLTSEQFEKIAKYVDSLPTVTHTVDFECGDCGQSNKAELKGLQDFF